MALTTPPRAVIGTTYRPYRRGVENAILGGVCGGLAIRLGVKERTVRILFSLLALVAGLGVLLYMVLWLTRPALGRGRGNWPSTTRATPRTPSRLDRSHRDLRLSLRAALTRPAQHRDLHLATALELDRGLWGMARCLE